MIEPIDYLSALTRLSLAGLSQADCERGALLLSTISPIVSAENLVERFITWHKQSADTTWEVFEIYAKRGYE